MRALVFALILPACVDLDPSHDANGDGDPANDDCWNTDCDSTPAYFTYERDVSSLDATGSRLAVGGRTRLRITSKDASAGAPVATPHANDGAGVSLTVVDSD